jgi:hypothetical protein
MWFHETENFSVDFSKGFESFNDLVLGASKAMEFRTLFGLSYYNDPDKSSRLKGPVIWKNGRLMIQSSGEELLLYHFQFGKYCFTSWLPFDAEPESFVISASGFVQIF